MQSSSRTPRCHAAQSPLRPLAATTATMPGELVFAGATDWKAAGRSAAKDEKYPNLASPHRLKALLGVKVQLVASGPAAAHCLAVDTEGRLYAWGRNETGQLGLGHKRNTNSPTLVDSMKGHVVTAVAGGKTHTACAVAGGEAFSWGLNKNGQLGTGSIKKSGDDIALLPVKSAVPACQAVAAGVEFTLWLCDGAVYSAGLPQYGQLGHGKDHEYNMKDGAVKLAYMPQPTPKKIEALAGAPVTKIACGHNHAAAVDAAGRCFTWGNGGYGRLGHKEQKDQMTPKQVVVAGGDKNACPPDGILAAGSTTTWVSAPNNIVYFWGKVKVSGDNQMYPKIFQDLVGWNIRSFACGGTTFAVAADTSTITWGGAQYGELGYGDAGKKSSANPAKVDALEGMLVLQVAQGVGQTLFLVDEKESARLAALPVYEAPEDEPEGAGGADAEEGGAGGSGAGGGKKRSAPGGEGSGKKKK